MLNKTKLILDLTSYFSTFTPQTSYSQKAQQLANIIEDYVKSGGIAIGSLSSIGAGNLGIPVSSMNQTTGTIE